MRSLTFLFICFASAAIGFTTKAALENKEIALAVRTYGPWVGAISIVALVVVGVGLQIGYLFLRSRIRKALGSDGDMSEAEIARGLVDIISTPDGVTDPTPEDRKRAAVVNSAAWAMRRQLTQFYFNATVTVFGGLIGAATLFLLYEQNEKIEAQTQKLEDQNRRITLQTDANVVQSVLLESARRTANSQQLNTLLMDIRVARENVREECSRTPEFNCWTWFDERQQQRRFFLPELLQQRVEAFARRNTPYFTVSPRSRSVEFDQRLNAQIDLPFQSPERGQLFQELVRNEFEVAGIDFSYSALFAADLGRTRYLPRVRLEWADMRALKLPMAYLAEADFRNANLTGANLVAINGFNAQFGNSSVTDADLSESYLVGASFRDAILNGANLASTNLTGTKFLNADLRNADFRSANLSGVDLRNSNLSNATMGWSNLSDADFSGSLQSELKLASAWAWEDAPPTGLEVGSELKLCKYQTGMERMSKPNDSACRSVVVSQSE